MFDRYTTNTAPKPDLLSIVASVKPGDLNGCRFCGKTILWNGGTWVHANDQRKCAHIRCKGGWVEGKTAPVEVPGFFRALTKQAPVCRCERCGYEGPAYLICGKWMDSLSFECPAAVATPITREAA